LGIASASISTTKTKKKICFQINKMIMAKLVFLIAMKFHNVELFFIEHAGELRIFILREEKVQYNLITLPWTRVRDATRT